MNQKVSVMKRLNEKFRILKNHKLFDAKDFNKRSDKHGYGWRNEGIRSEIKDMINSLENDLTFIDDKERRKGNFVAKTIVSSLVKKINEDIKNQEANINGLKVIIDSIKTIKDC